MGGLVLKVPTLHVNTAPEVSLIYVEDRIRKLPLEGNREDALQLPVKVYLTLISSYVTRHSISNHSLLYISEK